MKRIICANCKRWIKLDDDVYEQVKEIKWRCNNLGRIMGGKKTSLVFTFYRPPNGLEVDHINRDTHDNRRCNLRPATRSDNNCNKGPHPRNTSGYKGVYWDNLHERFVAMLKRNYKTYRKYCKTKEEAARAYDRFAILHHGEFAFTNFPKSDYL